MNLPKSVFPFIFKFAGQQWFKLLILIVTSVIWSMNESFFPYFIKRIVNTLQNYHGIPHEVYGALSGTLILLAVFWGANEVCGRVQGILQIYFFPTFQASIRRTVFAYVKSHSHEYFSSNFAGNIAKKLSDLPTSSQMLLEMIFFQFTVAFVGIVVVFIMMWLIHPLFAIILLLWLTIHLSMTATLLRSSNALWEVQSEAASTVSGKIIDALSNILNVKLFARTQYEMGYLDHFQQDEIRKSKKAMWSVELVRMGLGLNGIFLIFGMLFVLLHGWIQGWVTLGDFTQVLMQSFWLLGLIWAISYQLGMFAREVGVINNALSLLQQSHDIVDVPGAKSLVVHKGEICFEDVTFAYRQNHPVFEHLNVTIKGGQKIGLVGFSGSGKSTFVNLILRFYDLERGRILIDDQDIAKVKQDSLREAIAMIPQEPTLFHRTLMENLRYGRLDATDEEVIAASKLAHCHEFIEKMSEGYNTLVGERGIKLSGGQRQRIAIARAILKNAPILILDEATSSLDSVTEKLIQESLHELMQHRTTIVVAHRLSTLADMDKIVVFSKGKIIEEGTKEDLLQRNEHFANLWNMQSDGFLPEE